MKCLACSSGALVPGSVIDNGSAGTSVFKMDDVSKLKGLFGMGTRTIRGYACVHCGHLQLAVDFAKKDVERYRQFEGEQPSFLERLASETESGKIDS